MEKLIECVPNFSEGRDPDVIRQITDAIASVDGVSLLDVDPGATTNRTVVTFVGTPEVMVESAFRGIQKAAELIDMREHKGAHPRMGRPMFVHLFRSATSTGKKPSPAQRSWENASGMN